MIISHRAGIGPLVAICLAAAPLAASGEAATAVRESMDPDGLRWETDVAYRAATLVVTGPEGFRWQQSFEPGDTLFFEFRQLTDEFSPDGPYTYELVFVPPVSGADLALARKARALGDEVDFLAAAPLSPLSGTFTIAAGSVIDRDLVEPVLKDIVHPDDVIIQGSLCVGLDCINNENFGFDTIRLKENNLRIKFEDTSITSGFPSFDWQIIINDSGSGGANYFAVEDSNNARQVFRVTGGAPANSLFVDSGGRVGLGTAAPALNLHVTSGNTPALRLEQNGSSGFTAQTWDVAGNETNFFIRDATGGSKLPFRIQPGAPSNSIFVANDGDIGIGTSAPTATATMDVVGDQVVGLRMGNTAGGVAFRLDAGNENTDFWQVTSIAGDASLRFNRTGGTGNEFEVNAIGNIKVTGSCIEFAGPVACTAAVGSFSCAAGTCP